MAGKLQISRQCNLIYSMRQLRNRVQLWITSKYVRDTVIYFLLQKQEFGNFYQEQLGNKFIDHKVFAQEDYHYFNILTIYKTCFLK